MASRDEGRSKKGSGRSFIAREITTLPTKTLISFFESNKSSIIINPRQSFIQRTDQVLKEEKAVVRTCTGEALPHSTILVNALRNSKPNLASSLSKGNEKTRLGSDSEGFRSNSGSDTQVAKIRRERVKRKGKKRKKEKKAMEEKKIESAYIDEASFASASCELALQAKMKENEAAEKEREREAEKERTNEFIQVMYQGQTERRGYLMQKNKHRGSQSRLYRFSLTSALRLHIST